MPHYGLLPLAMLPSHSYWSDQRVNRHLDKPFPLTKAWVWEEAPRSEEEIESHITPVYDHGPLSAWY